MPDIKTLEAIFTRILERSQRPEFPTDFNRLLKMIGPLLIRAEQTGQHQDIFLDNSRRGVAASRILQRIIDKYQLPINVKQEGLKCVK